MMPRKIKPQTSQRNRDTDDSEHIRDDKINVCTTDSKRTKLDDHQNPDEDRDLEAFEQKGSQNSEEE